ncbi:MAG: hypothetical protein BGO01_01055 [Armatimonadetes bacterium 55-13]|nr:hypothetical protein [Armatimonadota bacterium]OJU65542.1 MAG: hypothetical protein BGO01_01055 [Armatimonadetes bacterium 55-13]
MKLGIGLGLFLVSALSALGQTGRGFVSVEAYVGLARDVRVGRIVSLDKIDGVELRTEEQGWGTPCRVVFEVSETIKGAPAKMLDLVLSPQHYFNLQCMLDNKFEIMLVSGPNRIDHFPMPFPGVEEQGKRVDGDFYQFRVLSSLPKTKPGDRTILEQLAVYYDEGRMFTLELDVVKGRGAILQRARTFAKKYPKMLRDVWLPVPNPFGELVGDPNAFCGIKLPICSETEQTLLNLLKHPERITQRMNTPNTDSYRDEVVKSSLKALREFPTPSTTNAVRYLSNHSVGAIREAAEATLRALLNQDGH